MAAKKTQEAKPEAVANVQPKFSKEQLLNAEAYQHRKDVLNAVLDDGKEYTKAQVDTIIGEFMKGQVK